MVRLLVLGVCLSFVLGQALAQDMSNPFAVRLEQAWKLVKERYYDVGFRGHDWDQIGEQYRAKLADIKDWNALYNLLDAMYGELGDDHSTVLSPATARLYLSGSPCQSLPFKEPADPPPGQTPPAKTPDASSSTPPQKPAKDSKPSSGSGGLAYQPPRVSFSGGVVVMKLTNLVDSDGLAQLQDAVRRYESKAKGYVLDLRGNPGGLALRMAEVAGVFMRGFPWRIVSRGVGGIPFPTIPLLGKPQTSKPLVVLIDGGVNSAAEGLAGALKNAKRAYLIGTKTAGNTEALTPYCFSDGGVALVAGGVLAPLSGPTWEGRGVEPDLLEADAKKQLEAAQRYILSRK